GDLQRKLHGLVLPATGRNPSPSIKRRASSPWWRRDVSNRDAVAVTLAVPAIDADAHERRGAVAQGLRAHRLDHVLDVRLRADADGLDELELLHARGRHRALEIHLDAG